jgi:hypothetical protein
MEPAAGEGDPQRNPLAVAWVGLAFLLVSLLVGTAIALDTGDVRALWSGIVGVIVGSWQGSAPSEVWRAGQGPDRRPHLRSRLGLSGGSLVSRPS